MSKMSCLCGSTIRDNMVPCPTEGWILRDEDQETYYNGVCRDIAAFFAAIHAGRRASWIAENFSPEYPTEVTDEGIVNDILCRHNVPVLQSIAECDQCGRLWVQREPEVNSYRSYVPDEGGYAAILRSNAGEVRQLNEGSSGQERS